MSPTIHLPLASLLQGTQTQSASHHPSTGTTKARLERRGSMYLYLYCNKKERHGTRTPPRLTILRLGPGHTIESTSMGKDTTPYTSTRSRITRVPFPRRHRTWAGRWCKTERKRPDKKNYTPEVEARRVEADTRVHSTLHTIHSVLLALVYKSLRMSYHKYLSS